MNTNQKETRESEANTWDVDKKISMKKRAKYKTQRVFTMEIIHKGGKKCLKELPHEDPAMGLIGIGNSKKGDISANHDTYLANYRTRRKR